MYQMRRTLLLWISRLSPIAAGIAVSNLWGEALVWLYGFYPKQWVIEAAEVSGIWPALTVGLGFWVVVLLIGNHVLHIRLRPRLKVEFDAADQDCKKPSKRVQFKGSAGGKEFVSYSHGVSIRLRVINPTNETAIGCEGFLTRIEFTKEGEELIQKPPIFEPNKISWVNDGFNKVNINAGIPKYLLIIEANERRKGFKFRSESTSNVTQDSFIESGEYHFYGSIGSEIGGTTHFKLGIRWNGAWDEIDLWLEKSI